MEPDGSLPRTQVPATCLCPEPNQSSPWPSYLFLKIHFNIILHLRVGLPSGLFPSGFPTNTLYTHFLSPISATSPAYLILLDFITQTLLDEEYGSLSSSLCSFLHSLWIYTH